MIQLTSKLTMDSRLLPGARVHLKKFNVKNAAAINLRLADYRAKMNEIYKRMLEFIVVPDETDENGAITKPGDPPEVRERKVIERVRLQGEIEALDAAYVKPELLREYVTGIEGVELDGNPLTPETLLSAAPPEFCDEIYTFMRENNGLPPLSASGSPSPSPSETPEDGKIQPTTATAA